MAQAISLVGEYNNWDPKPEHWAVRNEFGVWELFLPDSEGGEQAIPHRCGEHQAAACCPASTSYCSMHVKTLSCVDLLTFAGLRSRPGWRQLMESG